MTKRKLSIVLKEIARENEEHGIEYVCLEVARKYGWKEHTGEDFENYLPKEFAKVIEEDLTATIFSVSNGQSTYFYNNFNSAINAGRGTAWVSAYIVEEARVTYCYLLSQQFKEQGL